MVVLGSHLAGLIRAVIWLLYSTFRYSENQPPGCVAISILEKTSQAQQNSAFNTMAGIVLKIISAQEFPLPGDKEARDSSGKLLSRQELLFS